MKESTPIQSIPNPLQRLIGPNGIGYKRTPPISATLRNMYWLLYNNAPATINNYCAFLVNFDLYSSKETHKLMIRGAAFRLSLLSSIYAVCKQGVNLLFFVYQLVPCCHYIINNCNICVPNC